MKSVSFLSMFLLILLTACKSDEDQLAESAGVKYKANNFTGAIADYDKLISEHPSSKRAEEAYFAAAGIYQMNKIPNVSREEASRKAIKYLQSYLQNFPDADRAPKALFMVGFIEANDLGDYNSARMHYEEFLKKYPQNELVASVKMELENLGKSPDEILGREDAAAK